MLQPTRKRLRVSTRTSAIAPSQQVLADTADIRQDMTSGYITERIDVDIAKVFMTGRSQAVRLPKAYRFDTDEVLIEKLPDGAVVLRPKVRREGNLGDRLQAILEKAGDMSDFQRPEQGVLERDAAWWDANGFDAPLAPARAGKPARARKSASAASKRK